MIIVLKQDAPDVQVREFCHELEDMGLQINDSKGSDTHILGLIGDTKAIAESWVLANPVVETCRRVSEPYKKANRKFHPDDSVIDVEASRSAAATCGHRRAVQHRERGADHLLRAAGKGGRRFPAARRCLQAPHLSLLLSGYAQRGSGPAQAGAPRHRFAHCDRDHEHRAPALFENVDLIQVGARNMQNFELLKLLAARKSRCCSSAALPTRWKSS